MRAITKTLTQAIAKELTFTGRVVGAEEAVQLGIATRIAADPLAAALALANEIAGKSPDAIRAAKRLLEETWRAPPGAGLPLEASLQAGLIGSPNQVEAVRANFEKRAANYRDRG